MDESFNYKTKTMVIKKICDVTLDPVYEKLGRNANMTSRHQEVNTWHMRRPYNS